MKPVVLGISGSLSATSKTSLLVDYVLGRIADRGIKTEHIRLSSIDPRAIIRCETSDPDLARLADALQHAAGVVIATPIFKASYSGLLKAALDAMPQFGLMGKVVLPLATGGSPAHVLALDYGLRPVLQSMGARHIVQSFFVGERDFIPSKDGSFDGVTLSAPVREAIEQPLHNFLHSFTTAPAAHSLGHPRPDPAWLAQATC